MSTGLVVQVPHSSVIIPPEVRAQFLVSDCDLAQELTEFADLWTNRLAQAA